MCREGNATACVHTVPQKFCSKRNQLLNAYHDFNKDFRTQIRRNRYRYLISCARGCYEYYEYCISSAKNIRSFTRSQNERISDIAHGDTDRS